MSYCRWSCNNFASDLYVYEDVNGGWTSHVAGRRYAGQAPELPPIPKPGDDLTEWCAAKKAQSAWFESASMEPIGLSHDGQSFNDDSLQALKQRLLALRAEGYRVPDHAFEQIDAEIAEESAQAAGIEVVEVER